MKNSERKELESLISRLTRFAPWELAGGHVKCYFCGRWRDDRIGSDTDRRHHHDDCAYIEARNLVGKEDE